MNCKDFYNLEKIAAATTTTAVVDAKLLCLLPVPPDCLLATVETKSDRALELNAYRIDGSGPILKCYKKTLELNAQKVAIKEIRHQDKRYDWHYLYSRDDLAEQIDIGFKKRMWDPIELLWKA